MEIALPRIDWAPLAAMLPVAFGGLAALVGDLFLPAGRKRLIPALGLASLALSILVSIGLWGTVRFSVNDAVVLDRLALFSYLVFALVSILSILLSIDYLDA
ncbi:MAG: NADH-quinone oxidoreductase subunit N, partial [candidate division NC10 bacterium]